MAENTTFLDPSNVLPIALTSVDQASTSITVLDYDGEETSWLKFVKILCQNVFIVSRKNDAFYDEQCEKILNDLNIYQSCSQGRLAIFPARPTSPPRINTIMVSANHFKLSIPSLSEPVQPQNPGTNANSQAQIYLYISQHSTLFSLMVQARVKA